MWSYVKSIAVALTLTFLVRKYVFEAFEVHVAPGRIASVSPSLTTGQRVFVNRLFYRMFGPSRGDLVNFNWKGSPHMSRVVGYPGESVRLEGGRLFVEGRLLDEDYVAGLDAADKSVLIDRTLKNFLLVGDNRSARALAQSDYVFEVPQSDIEARLFFVWSFWQCNRGLPNCFGFLSAPTYNLERPPELKTDLDSPAVRAWFSM